MQIDIADLPIFIKHLAWLVCTVGFQPDITFIDPGQNITGKIYQYGKLNIPIKNKMADTKFKDVIKNALLHI